MPYVRDEKQQEPSIISLVIYLIQRILRPVFGVKTAPIPGVEGNTVEVKEFKLYVSNIKTTVTVSDKPIPILPVENGSKVPSVEIQNLTIAPGDVVEMNPIMMRHNEKWYFLEIHNDISHFFQERSNRTFSMEVPETVLGEELVKLLAGGNLPEELHEVWDQVDTELRISEGGEPSRVFGEIFREPQDYKPRGGKAEYPGNGPGDSSSPVSPRPENWGSFKGDGTAPERSRDKIMPVRMAGDKKIVPPATGIPANAIVLDSEYLKRVAEEMNNPPANHFPPGAPTKPVVLTREQVEDLDLPDHLKDSILEAHGLGGKSVDKE